jgi:sec-independent protein translocase protein TatB
MHFGDSIFIFLLALVLFGPKKLPEIGRQVGKLLAEFRRASNEFKFQIQEEMRNLEEDERRKKQAERQAQASEPKPVEQPALPAEAAPAGPTILPPSTGAPVSTSFGYSYPGPAEPTVTDAANSTEAQVDPSLPAEQAPSPQAAIAPGLTPEPPATADPAAINNGAHAPVDETPAHEVAHHD